VWAVVIEDLFMGRAFAGDVMVWKGSPGRMANKQIDEDAKTRGRGVAKGYGGEMWMFTSSCSCSPINSSLPTALLASALLDADVYSVVSALLPSSAALMSFKAANGPAIHSY
jgi:hypothetical protein